MTPIIRDWTKSILVLDITNSLGEQYHFEIEPGEDANSVPTRASTDPSKLGSRSNDGVFVYITLPIGTSEK